MIVYGGELNATTGKLKVTWTKIKLDANWTWTKSGSATNGFWADINENNIGIKTNASFQAEIFVYAENVQDYLNNYGKCFCDRAINFNIDPSVCGGTTLEDWKQYITDNNVYILAELATPISIDMDSVDWQTQLGDNNFYNDCGDTSVTYRQDIDLALSALQGSRGLMMASRSVSPMIGEEASLDRENILEEEELSENPDNEEEREER